MDDHGKGRRAHHMDQGIGNDVEGLNGIIRCLQEKAETGDMMSRLLQEVQKIGEADHLMIRDRKWCSHPVKGVLDAARAIGEAGRPIVAAVASLLKLLKAAML